MKKRNKITIAENRKKEDLIPLHRNLSEEEGEALVFDEELFDKWEDNKANYLKSALGFLDDPHPVMQSFESIPSRIFGEFKMDPKNRLLLMYLYIDLQRKKVRGETLKWDYKDMCDVMEFVYRDMMNAFDEFNELGYDLHHYCDTSTIDKDYYC